MVPEIPDNFHCHGQGIRKASELFQRYMSDLSTKSLDELAETYRELVQQAVLPSSGKEDGPVLDGGKVAGMGRHEELLKTCEIYKEIYHTQFRDTDEKGVQA